MNLWVLAVLFVVVLAAGFLLMSVRRPTGAAHHQDPPGPLSAHGDGPDVMRVPPHPPTSPPPKEAGTGDSGG